MRAHGHQFVRGILFAALVLTAVPAAAQLAKIPANPSGYVTDDVGVMSASAQDQVSRLARALEQKTSAQLAVVTVSSTQPETIEQYAVRLFEQWGVGQKGKDNGVLLLVAVSDRKVRIEVGYGLEGVLTDAMSRSIIESYIVPEFKANRYPQGILSGATAIVSLIAQDAGVTLTGQEAAVYDRVHQQASPAASIFRLIFMLIFFLVLLSSRSGLLWLLLFGSPYRRGGYWHGSGYRSGGGFGGGFGGGGFGGFGGGMSGGGGASGSW